MARTTRSGCFTILYSAQVLPPWPKTDLLPESSGLQTATRPLPGVTMAVSRRSSSRTSRNFDEADDVDGFEDLTPEDQEKFRKAFAEGHGASFVPACDRVLSPGSPFPRVDSVSFCSYMPRTVAEEDIPETARKEPELDEDGNPIESPKKGRGKGKKAKDADEDGDADEVGDCSDAALAPMAGLSHTPEDSSYSAG